MPANRFNIDPVRYDLAPKNVCGLLYRPGEMSMPQLNHCRLARGHDGNVHTTRTHKHDTAGFDWTPTHVVELQWPDEEDPA